VPLIDDRGRVFGKVNLIDAAVGLTVFMLIPLGYGSFVLFRTPQPRIVSVEPSIVVEGEESELTLQGEHLRPFLRATIGLQPATFLFAGPEVSAVQLPALAGC
jgi:hypothetical protein